MSLEWLVWAILAFVVLWFISNFIRSYIKPDPEQIKMIIPMPESLEEKPQISLEQTRLMVDEIIANKGIISVKPASEISSKNKVLDFLGPITREFFLRYDELNLNTAGITLSVSEICASEYVYGALSIGHSEDWDIIQWPGNDELFIVEGSETCASEMEIRFPSIYHLILNEANKI